MGRFELYKDNAGEYRWRFLAGNGQILATSSEGYKAKSDCQHCIDLVKNDAPGAKVDEQS